MPFRYFFGGDARRRYDVVPDQLVEARETLRWVARYRVIDHLRSL